MEYVNDPFWKPDRETREALKRFKKPEKKAKLNDKAKRQQERRAKKKREKEQRRKAREALIQHFSLYKYATNMGICLCIHNETKCKMPTTDKQASKMIVQYWKHLQGQVRMRKFYTDSEFYSSTKWKELRFIALQQSGGRCTLCGASAHDGVQLHVDHIKPRSKYPHLAYDLGNLQILCSDCNLGKSNFDETDFRNPELEVIEGGRTD